MLNYIIGSEQIPVYANPIKATKRIRHTESLAPDSRVTVLETDKEVILHALMFRFTHDDQYQDSFQIRLGPALYTPIQRSDFGKYTSFITPKHCLYDPIFETLVNEPGTRIVVLRKELRVKGVTLTLVNRNTENSIPHEFIGLYSEVE